jgi:RHS repeat-associated protein
MTSILYRATALTSFLYVGAQGVMTDPNGLYHMRARYYSPGLRRFLNEDPIGFGGGMNWYAYADGDPLMQVDPLGLKELRVVFYNANDPGGNEGGQTRINGDGFRWIANTMVSSGRADVAYPMNTQAGIVSTAATITKSGDTISSAVFLDHGVPFGGGAGAGTMQSFGATDQPLKTDTVGAVISAGTPSCSIQFMGCGVGSDKARLDGWAKQFPDHAFSGYTTNLILAGGEKGTAYYAPPADESAVWRSSIYNSAGSEYIHAERSGAWILRGGKLDTSRNGSGGGSGMFHWK